MSAPSRPTTPTTRATRRRYANIVWLRVSDRTPCRVCGKNDWCTVSADGRTACCMRIESARAMANGGWAHALVGGAAHAEPPRRPAAPVTPAALAPIERRDTVYRALIATLGLGAAHRAHLTDARGLPAEVLPLFASLPSLDDFRDRHGLARSVRARGGCALGGVPGFYRSATGWPALVKTPAGILVPVLDARGRVQGLQVRADAPRADAPRYTWLSSRGWSDGCSSGSPVAVWRPELASGDVWLTEGALKACVASYHLPARVVAVAGVSGWRAALAVVAELGATRVTIAFDMDCLTKPEVAHHRDALAAALERAGYTVLFATWNPSHKGVDDALLAGAEIHTAPATRVPGLPTRSAITMRRIPTVSAQEVARCLR